MRLVAVTLVVLALFGLTGCIVSSQEGERRTIHSKHPEQITFHFDTKFNRVLLYGRSGLLLFLGFSVLTSRGRGTGWLVPVGVAAACVALAVWWYRADRDTVFEYRIEARPDELSLRIPPEPETQIAWSRIEGMHVRGKAHDVRIFGGGGQALEWAPEWERVTLELRGGARRRIDLRPLSVEQRGTLCNAIGRKSGLNHRTQAITR